MSSVFLIFKMSVDSWNKFNNMILFY
jgi:hypothetical protein